jgi:hypothetical protein
MSTTAQDAFQPVLLFTDQMKDNRELSSLKTGIINYGHRVTLMNVNKSLKFRDLRRNMPYRRSDNPATMSSHSSKMNITELLTELLLLVFKLFLS